MTDTGAVCFCPICGKALDDTHSIEWDGWNHCWAIVCPTPLAVGKPLAHCTVKGLEVKGG